MSINAEQHWLYAAIVSAIVCYAGSRAVRRRGLDGRVLDVAIEPVVVMGLSVASFVLATYGRYAIVWAYLGRTANKRRRHDVRNVLRLAFGILGLIAVFGVVTREWVGVVFSLGIVGFAITFALQQPLFSLIGWLYIVSKRPYQVGDRIAIEEMRGDVVSIDFFVTEVWEIGGDLVSSNQPSGRIVMVPNSTILSARGVNFYGEGVQCVWNEPSIQVPYETDLPFASEVMIDVATQQLGDEMARGVSSYRTTVGRNAGRTRRERRSDGHRRPGGVLGRTPTPLSRAPASAARVRNALYEAILDRFNDHPDRVKFPVSRNR